MSLDTENLLIDPVDGDRTVLAATKENRTRRQLHHLILVKVEQTGRRFERLHPLFAAFDRYRLHPDPPPARGLCHPTTKRLGDHLMAETDADELVAITNEFNELLYDEIIPRLFRQLYDLDESQQTEEHEVELIKQPPQGYYEVSAAKDKIVRWDDSQVKDEVRTKSFHLDTYCFDSGSERLLF